MYDKNEVGVGTGALTSIPFWWYGLVSISACVSHYMSSKVGDEITYPFPNFNSYIVDVW